MRKILLTAGWDVAPKDDPDLIIWDKGDKISIDALSYYKGVEAIICGDEDYSKPLLEFMSPELKILYRAGNGWDAIDRKAATSLGIEVKRIEGAYAGPVADSTVGLILSLLRRINSLDRSMHEGKWERERSPGVAMQDVTIGIVGYGQIGREVCRRLRGFPCRTVVHRPLHDGPFSVELDVLLGISDVVSLHLALNEDTEHFIGADEINKMRDGSYLVNTSRGGLVDTDVLIEALRDGTLTGAALDVFEEEPLPEDHELRNMDNVILSPHNSYYSPSERKRVVDIAINGAKEWLDQTGP